IAGVLLERQGDQRIGLPKDANDARYKRMEWACGRNAEADSALLAARRASRCFDCLIELREHYAGFFEQGSPCIGQFDAPRFAPKQLHVELALDGSDPLTEWRLLHAEALRGSRDVPLLGDYNEISQLPQ